MRQPCARGHVGGKLPSVWRGQSLGGIFTVKFNKGGKLNVSFLELGDQDLLLSYTLSSSFSFSYHKFLFFIHSSHVIYRGKKTKKGNNQRKMETVLAFRLRVFVVFRLTIEKGYLIIVPLQYHQLNAV